MGRGISSIYDICMMDLHSFDVENITIQYTSDVKVGYSDVATLNVVGESGDDKAGFQCLRQAAEKIFKVCNMIIDGHSETCPQPSGEQVRTELNSLF